MSSKGLFRIGILAYVAVIFLSLFYYKERCFFIDIAFHLFAIIEKNGLAIQNYRFGAAITQIVPLLAVKAGLTLETVTKLYSVVFVAYYMLCYLVTGHVFKEYGIALVLLLVNILFATDSFFWIQSELQQALATLLLYWGYMRWIDKQPGFSYLHTVPVLLLNILLAFFHPLLFFPYSFICIYLFTDKKLFTKKGLLIYSFACFAAGVLIKKIWFATEYDSAAMANTRKLLAETFPHYFRLYANSHFLARSITWYFMLSLAVVVLCVLLGRQGKYKKLVFTGAFSAAYLLFVNISFPTSGTPDFYIENMYLPLSIFIGIPLFLEYLPERKEQRLLFALTLAAILIFPARIFFAAKPYTARVAWMRDFARAHEHEKLLVSGAKTPQKLLIMNWGTPYEFWLLSTIETHNTASILITDNMDEQRWKVNGSKALSVTWGFFQYADLSPRYFHFTDTSTTYKIVE